MTTNIKTTVRLAIALATLAIAGTALAAPPASKPTATAAADMKPVAVCRDGKTMYSATNEHRGACSGHGGVAQWSDGTPVKAKGGTRSYK